MFCVVLPFVCLCPRPLACCAIRDQLFVKDREYVTFPMNASVGFQDDFKVGSEIARAFCVGDREVLSDLFCHVDK